MEKEVNKSILLVTLVFLGWLGIDKFVSGGKKGWKCFLLKLLATFIFIGALWNILDIVMCILDKYRIDPREYLDFIGKKKLY